MSGKSDWEKACDHVMPQVCRPVQLNPPLPRRAAFPVPPTAAPVQQAKREEPAPIKAAVKTPVALRIGVFFDGTGNNADNSAQGLLCGARHPIRPEDLDASCKPYMSDPESSYGNDVSNVYKLWDLYRKSFEPEGEWPQQKHAFLKVYVEGIGTQSGEDDNLIGAGLGRGGSGVAARVQQSFSGIAQEITDFLRSNPDCEITRLTFDTFGFSRGAAAARHFANQVALAANGPLRSVLNGIAPHTGRFFVDQYQRDIDMGFIGLFDTVASVAGLGNGGNVRSPVAPGVKLHLPRRMFPQVVHLVARDERRANFALNRVGPDHPELVLPGAHSDIGGGYQAEAEECVLVSPMQAQEVDSRMPVEQTAIYRDAVQARERWLAQGWPAHLLRIVTPAPQALPADPQDRLAPRRQRVYAGLELKRPVRGELSRVYLRVMYELAKQNGVHFDDIPDRTEYRLPAELQPLSERFVAGDYSTTAAEETMLRLRYIHTSAHWNPPARLQGQAPRTGLRLAFINAPTSDGERVLHPHAANKELL